MMLFAMQFSFAAVEVNSADKAALDGIKDIGPKLAATIVAERDKNGKFKDWEDLVKRVKGVGPKNSDKMSAAGLTVNGGAKPNAPAKKSDDKAKMADKPMADKGKDAKAPAAAKDAKDAKPMADTGKEAKPAADAGKDGKKDMKKDEPKK